ncbi:uncharacterized protein F4822DRAFT_386121 [Hypoxylon trugodes]|uniref:uncharacterized protein n=1 Tax=Hypoxylon trugodes TaxID=326681 RepID=UPI00219CF8F5|nr:uncharacterized protein F4822DRAFT_386121 [Hypoxylon trugodes]KAI1393845.1 hypothetical protein F4822DRAFT_386121 [Hypoxylon trugodes]
MAPPSEQPTPQRPTPIPRHAENEMPSANELMEIGKKSLQTGALTGGIGLVVGAGSGIVRSAPPALFALFAGLQWFALGSSYMASRSLLWHAWGGEENLSRSGLVAASGIAGGVSGMVGGMFRGPRNIIPGILVFGTLGTTSTYITQVYKTTFRANESKPKSGWLDSKYSPLQRLSDRDYEEKLEEKILRIDAEISLIDDSIASLRASNNDSTKSNEEKR